MILKKNATKKISTLEHLISALKLGQHDDVLTQSFDLVIPLEELQPYISWNPNRYTRNCIVRNEDFELILLCWEKGQKTAIHCHNDQECWVKVIRGDFEECLYEYDEAMNLMSYTKTDQVSQNQVTITDDKDIYHTLENISQGRSISLHLYMKPILECGVFNQKTNQLETKTLVYDTLEGKEV